VSSSIRDAICADIPSRLRLLAYPQLRKISVADQEEALRIARRTELDLLERIGILGGLVGTTAVLQALGADWNSAPARFLAQFALALPLLLCVVGPFLLRRTRRGLDIEWRRKTKQ
jgi:hypothetical protein